MLPPKRAIIAAAHDSVMAALSFIAAMYLRLGTHMLSEYNLVGQFTLLFSAIATCVFISMGLYRGVWRYASSHDLIQITKATTLSILIFTLIVFFINRLDAFPRSVFIIHWLVLTTLLGAPRFMYRMLKDKTSLFKSADAKISTAIPVLLIGISETSLHFLKACRNKASESPYHVVGIVDTHHRNIGRHIQGTLVYGIPGQLPSIMDRLTEQGKKPQRLILGLDRVEGSFVQFLLNTADTLGLTLAKLPKITEFKERFDTLDIRPIAIEDLLGRAPTTPKKDCRRDLIQDKCILVTGAGGTIGSELVDQIASQSPRRIIALDHSEFNIYALEKNLRTRYPEINLRPIILDIRNIQGLHALFQQEQPDIVFHAAALKHVPLVEDNLVEATSTNILGMKAIADMCLHYKTHKMIFISTDKAVNPSSFMGVTKRIAERYIHALGTENQGTDHTQFTTVRFGNVLGSSGSVIPLFQQQLASGGPLTVTHPDMTRFFMTVPEAVELVLRAATIDTGKADQQSNIFVLDMGKPIRIADVAQQMIQLAGLRPGIDIHITYTGIRPGEKLYEELFYAHETPIITPLESIMRAHSATEPLAPLEAALYDIAHLCTRHAEDELRHALLALVPQYLKIPALDNIAIAA